MKTKRLILILFLIAVVAAGCYVYFNLDTDNQAYVVIPSDKTPFEQIKAENETDNVPAEESTVPEDLTTTKTDNNEESNEEQNDGSGNSKEQNNENSDNDNDKKDSEATDINPEDEQDEQTAENEKDNTEAAAAFGVALDVLRGVDYAESAYAADLTRDNYELLHTFYTSAFDNAVPEFLGGIGLRNDLAVQIETAVQNALAQTPIIEITADVKGNSADITVISNGIDLTDVRYKVENRLFSLPAEDAMAVFLGGEEALINVVFPILISEVETASRTRFVTQIKLTNTDAGIWELTDKNAALDIFVRNLDALTAGIF